MACPAARYVKITSLRQKTLNNVEAYSLRNLCLLSLLSLLALLSFALLALLAYLRSALYVGKLGAYSLGAYSLGAYSSWTTDFGSASPLTTLGGPQSGGLLGAYSLGAYTGGLQSGGLQFLDYGFWVREALTIYVLQCM